MRFTATRCWHAMVVGLLIQLAMVPGCGSNTQPNNEEEMNFDDFVDGKYDTGYVGDRAVEIEAKLISRLFVDTTYMTSEARQRFLDRVASDPGVLAADISEQVKYAKTQLQANKFSLNLERAEPVILGTEVAEDGVWADYYLQVDSLIKFKDLAAKGLTPNDLVGEEYTIALPKNHKTVFAVGGLQCSSSAGEPVPAEELNSWNFFYYFDPFREGCPLEVGEHLVNAAFVVQSSLNAPTVYPEYDLLVQDGLITMVVLFGQINHGEFDKKTDWGWYVYEEWTSFLLNIGFIEVESFDNEFGKKHEKIYPGDLKIIIDTYSPLALAEKRDEAEKTALFQAAISGYELVLYNGHSFYGSLKVLDDPSVYPKDTYQIFFMDSCWSYSYYTRQIFQAKSTPDDPDGTRFADVVNNTEVGWMSYGKPFYKFYETLFNGASRVASQIQPTSYSWNNLVSFLNLMAEQRARGLEIKYGVPTNPEIYGVSGVRNNKYLPVTVTHEGITVENDEEHEIQDNDEVGVSSSITIEDPGIIAAVFVSLNIEHTWNADLVVTLTYENPYGKGSREVTLFNRFGSTNDTENLVFDAEELYEFNGLDMMGLWTLTVRDVDGGGDIGVLKGWSIRVVYL